MLFNFALLYHRIHYYLFNNVQNAGISDIWLKQTFKFNPTTFNFDNQ